MLQAILRNAAAALLMLAVSGGAIGHAAEPRVALVIGNSAYRNAAPLENPRNDAEDIAVAVERLGFTVIRGIDLDKSGMDRTLRRFAESLKGAGTGLFFYAGHGLQVSGRNYLVPVDAELRTAEALDFEMVGLDVVQRIMEAAAETNILFVDACRDNPLSRNLARAMGTRSAAIGHGLTAQEAGAGTLISFSTQPGNVALDGVGSRNSPYAGALARHIGTQGKALPAVLVQVRREVMAATGKRQIPWEHSALTAEVVLARQDPGRAPAAAAPAAEAGEGDDGEAGDDAPDGEAKTALSSRSEASESAGEPKQRVVKVGAIKSTLKIVNGKSDIFLFNENGRKILFDRNGSKGALPAGEAVELPAGRYHLKSESDLVAVKPFEVAKGENVVVDLRQHVGFLRIVNNKDDQHLYTQGGRKVWFSTPGKFNMGAVPRDRFVELPPGRYELKSGNPLSGAEQVEIKVGEETVIDFGG